MQTEGAQGWHWGALSRCVSSAGATAPLRVGHDPCTPCTAHPALHTLLCPQHISGGLSASQKCAACKRLQTSIRFSHLEHSCLLNYIRLPGLATLQKKVMKRSEWGKQRSGVEWERTRQREKSKLFTV